MSTDHVTVRRLELLVYCISEHESAVSFAERRQAYELALIIL